LTVRLIAGATQLGTQQYASSASVGWKSFVVTNSLSQTQVNNLKIEFAYS
jgi:hypothetical protein